MNGLCVLKRAASTSSSIFAVSSAITFLSGKPMPAVIDRSLSYRRWSPALPYYPRPARTRRSRNHRQRHIDGTDLPLVALSATGCPLSRAWQAENLTSHHFPLDRLPAAVDQRFLIRSLDFYFLWGRPRGLFERDPLLVGRQAIVLRAVERGKGFELVERAFLLEHLGVCLDCNGCIEQAGDAVHRELLRHRMRRGVGAEEIAGFARGRSLAQRRAVLRGFDDRHAVHVGLEPPTEPIGAGQDHVVGRDRSAHLRRRAAHEIDSVLRGQMLQDEAQARELPRPL